MRWTRLFNFAVLAALICGARSADGQISDITWTGDPGGVEDWNLDDNWLSASNQMFIPDITFAEGALIDNGGTAFVASAATPTVARVQLISGGVEIRNGGMLAAGPDPLMVDPAYGAVIIGGGGNGVGRVDVLPGGSLNAESLTMGGSAASALNLSGNAAVTVTGDANLLRTARIAGSNVLLEVEGDLEVNGTFIPQITGPNHSAIQVTTGTADLGGTLRPEFGGGFTPALGDSWTLIDAVDARGSFAVDGSQAANLPRGAAFAVSYDAGGSGDVVLSVNNTLILTVDRVTGAAGIENANAAPIDFDSYTIFSASGLLSVGGWNSLESSGAAGPNWAEANPTTNHISELNLLGSTSATSGNSLSLGTPYVAGPLGPDQEDLMFEYSTIDGVAHQGIVEYTGPINDLVLRVDPATGEAVIQNLSTFFSANIDSYTISSSSGSLDPSGFNSFEVSGVAGPGWFEANPTTENISELNLTSSTLFSTGTSVAIGAIFDTTGVTDLTFQYTSVGGGGGPLGDTNGDNMVNIDDLNNVRNNFGGAGLGDTNGDGLVNIDDLNNVRNNFGATGGGGGPAGIFFGTVEYGPINNLAPVPEPAGVVLLALSAIGLALHSRR